MDLLYIDGESPSKRNNKDIKDNLIELTADKIKPISMKTTKIEEE